MIPRSTATWSTGLLTAFAVSAVWASGCADAQSDDGTPVEPPARDTGPDAGASPGTIAPPQSDAGAPPRDPGPPAVRFVGRFDTRDEAGPRSAWPGARIIANFSGTRVAARLTELEDDWMQGGPSEWDVAIDGVWQPKITLEQGAHDYVLASGLPSGPHRVELYKRSETQNGVTQFGGYDFGGGTLLPPPLTAERRIEIIGDSQPAAFGVEGASIGPKCPYPMWAARWQNFHLSFGARLGELFDADVAGTVYSGKGLAKNIYRTDPDTMPLIYGRANPIDPQSTFDLDSFVPDVVVVMLGGNDFAIGQPYDDGPASLATFEDALSNLVATVRTHYPSALVLLTVSPSVTDEEPAGRQSRTNVMRAMTTLSAARAQAGDAHIEVAIPALAVPSELTGCDGHGTPAFHDRVAHELAAIVSSKLGW